MLKKYASIRYLGTLTGVGVLKRQGEDIGQAAYDFELYIDRRHVISCNGEIRILEGALKGEFDSQNLQLLTESGRLLDLAISESQNLKANGRAYVDVAGDLPTELGDLRH